MKIYFAGSIRGGRNDADLYAIIIDMLKGYGEVLTEHVGDASLLKDEKKLNDKQIHDRDVSWLKDSDIMVAEVTQPSLGVGYELAVALQYAKKVLCLYNNSSGNSLSAMIAGQPNYTVVHYNKVSDVKGILKHYFEQEIV